MMCNRRQLTWSSDIFTTMVHTNVTAISIHTIMRDQRGDMRAKPAGTNVDYSFCQFICFDYSTALRVSKIAVITVNKDTKT